MGLIVIETCEDCGHKGVPILQSEGFCCRGCGSGNFEKPVLREEDKITCRCGHKYFFNDVGCPKCIKAELKNLGVSVKTVLTSKND